MNSTLEQALSALEGQLAAVTKAAKSALAELKKAQKNAASGALRELGKALPEARAAARQFADQMAAADSSWTFDVEGYFANGGYLEELQQAAAGAGLQLFARDGRVYCSPLLLTLAGKDLAIMINRKPERRLRPRELVSLLKERQRRPQRFNEQNFLETLFKAYRLLGAQIRHDWMPESAGVGPVVSLFDIYDLITLWPGAERDYPKEEFARDIYLLDRRPALRTKSGHHFALPAATGTKNFKNLVTLIDEQGNDKVYSGIRFDKE